MHWDKKTDEQIVNAFHTDEQKALIQEGLFVIRKEVKYLNISLDKKARALENRRRRRIKKKKVLARQTPPPKLDKYAHILYPKMNEGSMYQEILDRYQERKLRGRFGGILDIINTENNGNKES
jgi:hypothetical protein